MEIRCRDEFDLFDRKITNYCWIDIVNILFVNLLLVKSLILSTF